jgi:hypothetical protein
MSIETMVSVWSRPIPSSHSVAAAPLAAWTYSGGEPERALTRDKMLIDAALLGE